MGRRGGVTHHLVRGPGAREGQRPRFQLPQNPLVRAVFVGALGLSGLFSLAMCAAMMAFLGWVFFRMFEDDLASGLVVAVLTVLCVGVSGYIGLRVGLKMRRQSENFLQEYRQRQKAKTELPRQPDPQRGNDLETGQME